MTAITTTYVANLALSESHMNTIEDFNTEASEVGDFLRTWWPVVFRELIDDGYLPIFQEVASLPLDSATAKPDNLYEYTLPEGFVRLNRILTNAVTVYTVTTNLKFRCNTKDGVTIEFLSTEKMYFPHTWSPTFMLAFRSRLSALLHGRFDSDSDKEAQKNNTALGALKEAQIHLGQQNNRTSFTIDTWRGSRVRRGYGGYNSRGPETYF